MSATKPRPGTRPNAVDDRLHRLTTLLEVSRLLTSELDSSEIVHTVLTSAIAVIPAADVGTLYLVDASTGKLVATDTVGFGPSIFKIQLEPGEGAAGRAVLSGHGEIFAGLTAIRKALGDANQDTYRLFSEASRGFQSLTAAMTAPLVFKGKILGALVVDALNTKHSFSQNDLKMLEDFAQIAAVAIVNARLYGSEHTSRLRLEVLNDEITRQRDLLDRRLRAFDSMSDVVREGLGLPALAARVATLCSARAYILDGLGRVRACDPTASAEREPPGLLESADFRKLVHRVGHDHHRHSTVADRHLVVSPIVGGYELLGYIVLDSTETDSVDVNEALADMAALVASTVFLQERAAEEGQLRRRTDLLQRLLEGMVPKSSTSFKPLPPPWRLAVGRMQARPQGDGPEAQLSSLLRKVRSIAEQVLRDYPVTSVAAVYDDSLVIAWSGKDSGSRESGRECVAAIRKAIGEATEHSLSMALTETIDDPELIAPAYLEARLALEARSPAAEGVVEVGTLGAYRLILGATSAPQAVGFARATLGKVIERDAKAKVPLLSTLRTYFETGMSVGATARRLGIHVHTVQYRLSKVEELTGRSVTGSEDRLTLELALRILDLSGLAAP